MQKTIPRQALARSTGKARQAKAEERVRTAVQTAAGGEHRAAYASLPSKDKARYARELTKQYYRAPYTADRKTPVRPQEASSLSGGAGTHRSASGRTHGGSAGSFGAPSPSEQRKRQKDEARREIARRSFNLIGTAAAQAMRAATGTSVPAGQQLEEARRQADNARAIREAKLRFDSANALVDWNGRQKLLDELEEADRSAGWEIGEEQANAAERRRRELLTMLREGDLAAGNGVRSGTDVDTGRDIVESTIKKGVGAAINVFSNIGKNLEMENAYRWKPSDAVSDLVNGDPWGTSKRRRIEAYEDPVTQGKWKPIDDAADRQYYAAAAALQRAREGKSFLGEVGIDAAQGALEAGFDGGFAVLTGGSALIPMGLRVYGESVGEARRAGASPGHQTEYALANTGVEILTEKLFDGLAGIYGAGAADALTERLIGRLTESEAGRTALRTLAGAAGGQRRLCAPDGAARRSFPRRQRKSRPKRGGGEHSRKHRSGKTHGGRAGCY